MASAIRHAGFSVEAGEKRSAQTNDETRLSSPEDIFVAWRLWLPDDADLAAAAAYAITRIDRHAPLSPDLKCLRGLLIATIDAARAV